MLISTIKKEQYVLQFFMYKELEQVIAINKFKN